MNWAQFKDLVSHVLLALWSLTQEVAGCQVRTLLMTNIFVTVFSKFSTGRERLIQTRLIRRST